MEKEERKEALSKVLRFFAGLFLWFILMMGWVNILGSVLHLRVFKSNLLISKYLFGGLGLAGMIGFGYLVWLFFTKAEEEEVKRDY